MAAIFADAAVFGYKALSKESSSLSYDEKSTLSPELWSDLKPQDPCPCSKQDFIVFAEFSEVMGPIPLLTIPLHTAEKSGIEINNFIMRVMSVDYQANPSQSVFCEDAQVLRLFVMPDVHAYVHYLTLHDPGARGFVRPLCLAYVTADQYKLSQLFPKLRNQFLQVTQVIKYNNRIWFRDEIKSIIHCIKETQYKYLSWKKKEEDGAEISEEGQHMLKQTNMDQLVQQSTDFTHMLHSLEPLLKIDADENLAVIDRWKHGFEEANKSDMILSVYSITSRIGNNTNHLKGILALSPWGFSAAIWNLLSLLISHHECRLTQYPTPASLQDWKLQRFPQRFAVPEITGLLDMDWDEYITRERRLHGGQLWALERSVAVYYNGKFIGSDIDLFEELSNESTFLLPMEEDYYKISAYLEYVKFLQKSKRVYCYMDISIDDAYVGTLTFQLYSDLLPETCEVFRCLCTGEMGTNEDGIELNYRDSQIHRIVKTCWIQGGDIENKIGGGGVSILSRTFPDESYCIGHDRRGVLSMANDGKHTNASQFFITLQPMEWMDYYYVAFG